MTWVDYDFYRCRTCHRLITNRQMQAGLSRTGEPRICPCGGLTVSPTNPHWYEYLLPRVWVFAVARVRRLA